ncbi:MAG: hypothetical protein L0Z70_01575 [Chloroflexi bacterium]|nr:hypothetical protein [Chloroflexota bacterium]
MTFPAFLLGLVISTLYGVVFHFWRGGGLGRLILYILLGWAGFWAGHFAAAYFGWSFASLGVLQLGPATLFSAIFLGVGYWLSLVEVERK